MHVIRQHNKLYTIIRLLCLLSVIGVRNIYKTVGGFSRGVMKPTALRFSESSNSERIIKLLRGSVSSFFSSRDNETVIQLSDISA